MAYLVELASMEASKVCTRRQLSHQKSLTKIINFLKMSQLTLTLLRVVLAPVSMLINFGCQDQLITYYFVFLMIHWTAERGREMRPSLFFSNTAI